MVMYAHAQMNFSLEKTRTTYRCKRAMVAHRWMHWAAIGPEGESKKRRAPRKVIP